MQMGDVSVKQQPEADSVLRNILRSTSGNPLVIPRARKGLLMGFAWHTTRGFNYPA
jgi:hypothetical protein